MQTPCYAVGVGVVQRGERNPNWRGGRTVASNGYVLVKVHGHRLADVRGYVYEHRLVADGLVEGGLRPGTIVHHKNGDKRDNRPANLDIVESHAAHVEAHGKRNPRTMAKGDPNPSVACGCGCGASFLTFDRWGRPRRFVLGHNTVSR